MNPIRANRGAYMKKVPGNPETFRGFVADDGGGLRSHRIVSEKRHFLGRERVMLVASGLS